MSPIATPPRGEPLEGLNTPNGKFWIGNSECPSAEATQLRRFESWVSSIALIAPPSAPPRQSHNAGRSNSDVKIWCPGSDLN